MKTKLLFRHQHPQCSLLWVAGEITPRPQLSTAVVTAIGSAHLLSRERHDVAALEKRHVGRRMTSSRQRSHFVASKRPVESLPTPGPVADRDVLDSCELAARDAGLDDYPATFQLEGPSVTRGPTLTRDDGSIYVVALVTGDPDDFRRTIGDDADAGHWRPGLRLRALYGRRSGRPPRNLAGVLVAGDLRLCGGDDAEDRVDDCRDRGEEGVAHSAVLSFDLS